MDETEEITLVDYIKIIIKRKKLILFCFSIGLIIGGVLFLFESENSSEAVPTVSNVVKTAKQEKYKVRTLLMMGGILDDPLEVAGKVNAGVYGDYSGLNAITFEGTRLLRIEIITTNKDEAKQFLEDLNKAIVADHTNQTKLRKEDTENYKARTQAGIDYLIVRGQQVADLERRINDFDAFLENLQTTQVVLQPTAASYVDEKGAALSVPSPSVSKIPRKPNLALNLVLGGALGIFAGLCLAFGKEWWDENKEKIRS